jgi:D-lactate dehydrogenase
MRTLFYNTHEAERAILEAMASGRHDIIFIEDMLSLEAAGKSKSFDAVSISSTDNCTAPVLEELHKNGIRFITMRAAYNNSIDLARASELGITVAHVPASPPAAATEISMETIQYIVAVTFYNIDCRKKDLRSGNELTGADRLAMATVYFR